MNHNMFITNMKPIGFAHTKADKVPRHWTVSDVEGTLVIDEQYQEGLSDIKAGQRIVVIFHFHQSSGFTTQFLKQIPGKQKGKNLTGVFSICSPIRPNPIGMSVLEVLGIKDNIIYVKGVDMIDGTPILDIKPHVLDEYSCPSSV